jgi:hypothetical protein
MEEELAGPCEYEDRCEGKRARYKSSSELRSGIVSPALPVTTGGLSAPSQQPTHMVAVVPFHHVQEDVNMDDGESAFPSLPAPSQPMAPTMGAPLFQHGANWMPAPPMRQPSITRGSPFGRRMSRPTGFVIRSLEELYQHLEVANTPGNELAVAWMRAYIREAQNVPKETRSLVQCKALTRWKIPTCVLAEARPTQRVGDPNAPAVVNTPWLADPPEEWARWLWRYPREAETRPGI